MPRLFLILAFLVLPRAAMTQNGNTPAAPDIGTWQAPAGSRRYVAVEGTANPWIFDLVITGGRVTGEARQRPANPAVTEAPGPFQVLNGTARGDTIAFTIESNGGDRVVRFRGLRIGDRIDFNRSVEVVRGAVGGNGIVGTNGATIFSARLVAQGQSIPTRNALAQESVTKPLTGPRQTVVHRGFTIDVTEVTSAADYASVITAMKGQLDLVANVKMPAAAHAFFRTVPIVMQDITGRPRYGAGRVVIPLRSEAPYGSDRPIVLHELCHAYHDLKLADGFSNSTILGFYEQAKQSGKFPGDSYMLSTIPEYFAMMASVFLHGSAARDPFVRDSIRAKQPAMYDWLVKEFGQRAAPSTRNRRLAFVVSRNGAPKGSALEPLGQPHQREREGVADFRSKPGPGRAGIQPRSWALFV